MNLISCFGNLKIKNITFGCCRKKNDNELPQIQISNSENNLNEALRKNYKTVIIRKLPQNFKFNEEILNNTDINYTLIFNSDLTIISAGEQNLFTMIYNFNIQRLINKKLDELPVHCPIIKIIKEMIKIVKEDHKARGCIVDIDSKVYLCCCFPIIGDQQIISFLFNKKEYFDIDISVFDF
jgi:hypothetical protein